MILFGFEINRAKKTQEDESVKSFAIPQNDDGAVTIQSGAYYGTYVDLDGVVRNEIELITRYRELSIQPEIETAIDEIVNEAIVNDDTSKGVELNLDDLKQPAAIKKKINEEFENILKLLDFSNMGHDIFRRWYVDGRMFYHVIVDEANQSKGIRELRYVDPRRIRKIREIQKAKEVGTGTEIVKSVREYYIYNERGVVGAPTNLGMKIAVDSVVNINSGLMDSKRSMVLSYLHKAIKPFNNLRMVEDASVIYRLSRAPERRIFYVDVGNMSTVKAEQYLKDIMTKYRNKLVYDSCLDMKTLVPLLDGRTLTITEIQKEFEDGKQLWIYSCDPKTGKFAPGLVTSAGVTRFDEKVMRLTLDNGKTITCTYDHKFPVWKKGKVEAKDLAIGDSMFPFYAREKPITSKSKSTYQQIFENEQKKWLYTHRLVSDWKDSIGMFNEYVFNEENAANNKKTVHHKNYNRYDNTPNNLTRMNRNDHFEYHKQHNSFAGKIGGKATAQKRKEEGIPFFPVRPSKEILIESGKKLAAKKLGFQAWTDEEKKNHNIKNNRKIVERLKDDSEFNEKFRKAISDGWKEESRNAAAERGRKTATKLHKIKKCNVCEIETTVGNIKRWHNENCKKYNNHKIVKIEYLDERIDVGTLGIDKYEVYHDFHTFALDAGIYTCNSTGEVKDDRKHLSMLEDFYLPRREGSRGTEISTLPGAMNLGELEDVKYFEKKLYKSLGVPISRLEPSQGFSLGRTTEITRDELKFTKFIARLRNKFSSMFDDLLRVQLILKKVCTEEEWKEFREDVWYDFKQDNNFSELKESELLNNRLANLSVIDPFVGRYYSKEWVRKNVLMQDDKDIEEIDEQIAKEAQDATPIVDSAGNTIDPATGQPIQPAPTDPMNGQDPNAEAGQNEQPPPPKFSLPTNSITAS
jgi:hypothetical protein